MKTESYSTPPKGQKKEFVSNYPKRNETTPKKQNVATVTDATSAIRNFTVTTGKI